MNMAFQLKRPDDMPLKGKIVRERKGVYVCMITFVQSRRWYGDEIVYARNTKEVKAHLARLYPTLTFGVRKRKNSA
jgi:hypothetical protein